MLIRQTKFVLAMGGFLVASLALFISKADFNQWATFMGTLFTMYGVAHVTDTHMQQKKSISRENQTA